MKNFILIFMAGFMLSACVSLPPLNFSVPNVGPSNHKINAELKNTTVTLARPDEKTGDLPATAVNITPLWKESLQEALDRMAIFKDDAAKKVSLSVKIMAFKFPSAGGAMTTSTTAKYELLDRETGAIIYTEVIEASGTTPFGYALVGAVRGQESVNRAVQNNISKFLMALETVNINKPAFTGRK